MPKIIGVTGRLGSGKTFCTREWAAKDSGLILEVDPIRHSLVNYDLDDAAIEMRAMLAKEFKVQACPQINLLDTVSLVSKIFENSTSLKKCADICTPYIKEKLREKIKESTADTIYVVWAYLIEQDYLDLVDEAILVSCPCEETVLERIAYSPYFTLEQALQRRALEPSDSARTAMLEELGVPFKVYLNV